MGGCLCACVNTCVCMVRSPYVCCVRLGFQSRAWGEGEQVLGNNFPSPLQDRDAAGGSSSFLHIISPK